MTDTKQTKCPHCGSTFRISDAQLAAKGGSVRCGSCLQVFRADQHLVGTAVPAATPAPAAAKPKKKGADESWAENLLGKEGGASAEEWKLPEAGGATDDFGFNEDDISDFITKGAPAVEAPKDGKSILFDDELSDQLESVDGPGVLAPDAGIHRLNENADESWAQDILSELETEEQKEAKKKYSMEILDEKSKAPPKNPKLAAAIGMGAAAAAASAKPSPRPPAGPADDFLNEDADALSFLDNDDLGPVADTSYPATSNPFSFDRPLAHVDAPVVLKPRGDPIRWGYFLGWTFLCLIAASMFVAQYVYFNFEMLAVDPRARPVFEQVCTQFQCRLPDIPDLTKLRVEELVVRKHPEAEGALVVDAIVKNNATFAQPFPMLRLRFSSAAGEVIASRQLKPLQYLQGEARLMRRIPPETSVHVSLEIVDPGQEAVAYSIDPVF